MIVVFLLYLDFFDHVHQLNGTIGRGAVRSLPRIQDGLVSARRLLLLRKLETYPTIHSTKTLSIDETRGWWW